MGHTVTAESLALVNEWLGARLTEVEAGSEGVPAPRIPVRSH
jgi:hypothetical protein